MYAHTAPTLSHELFYLSQLSTLPVIEYLFNTFTCTCSTITYCIFIVTAGIMTKIVNAMSKEISLDTIFGLCTYCGTCHGGLSSIQRKRKRMDTSYCTIAVCEAVVEYCGGRGVKMVLPQDQY